jgi:hypothetical protein
MEPSKKFDGDNSGSQGGGGGVVEPIASFEGDVPQACGPKAYLTEWTPTPEEMKMLVQGGKVYLAMYGKMVPAFINVHMNSLAAKDWIYPAASLLPVVAALPPPKIVRSEKWGNCLYDPAALEMMRGNKGAWRPARWGGLC